MESNLPHSGCSPQIHRFIGPKSKKSDHVGDGNTLTVMSVEQPWPPILIGFSSNGNSVAASSLYWPAAYFVFGVVASGFCSYFAYVNYQIIANSSDNLQRLEYVKWHRDHMPEYFEANKKHFEETKSINLPKFNNANKWACITAWIGVLLAVASFGCFFRGCQLAGSVLLAIQ